MTGNSHETLESLRANLRIAEAGAREVLYEVARREHSEEAWGNLGAGLSGLEATIARHRADIAALEATEADQA